MTAIMRASQNGHLEIVRALLAAGASRNSQNAVRAKEWYIIWGAGKSDRYDMTFTVL